MFRRMMERSEPGASPEVDIDRWDGQKVADGVDEAPPDRNVKRRGLIQCPPIHIEARLDQVMDHIYRAVCVSMQCEIV
jgi:hypothetical protein